jgi:hypothetical protein
MPCAYIKELKMQFCALALPPIFRRKAYQFTGMPAFQQAAAGVAG